MSAEERASKKQKELLAYVVGFIQGNGYGPSYREIMRALGYKSVSTVAVHIDNLIAKGYLHKKDNSARSLEVVTTNVAAAADEVPSSEVANWLVGQIKTKLTTFKKEYSKEASDDLKYLIEVVRIAGENEQYTKLLSAYEEIYYKYSA